MRMKRVHAIILALAIVPHVGASAAESRPAPEILPQAEGFVDTGSAFIYFKTIGRGQPLLLLHGGPGSTHDYFLPYVLPLASYRQLVFIDQRGSGQSQRLEDHKQYNLEAMAGDVEAVRAALGLGKIDLLGHSFGGILAQEVAIRYPTSIRRLVLASTGSSAARIDEDFRAIKASLDPNLRARIEALEAQGIIGPDGAQLPEYRQLADKAQKPYNYVTRPPTWDGSGGSGGSLGWDVLKEMWGAKTDFHIDGNLKGFDFTPQLRMLQIPTLVIYGDHDLVSDATALESHEALVGSKLVEMSRAAHMTMVDQNGMFIDEVAHFLDQ
jgi:proline iminopeptidase